MYDSLYQDKNRAYFNHVRPELTKFIPLQNKQVLDVGCGSGLFGKMLNELHGCVVYGVEPDQTAAKEALQHLDKVYNGLFAKNEPMQFNDKKFDCIFFNDVLEHMPQPEEALKLASTMLAPDGYIIASIPNIRFYPVMLSLLRYKDFKYQDAGVMDKTHLRFFTQKSMMRLFEESGLTVTQSVGINKHQFKYFNVLNALLFNRLEDMKYPQFAIVAKVN